MKKNVRCTHFYDWSAVSDKARECVFNEFAENGVTTLTFGSSFAEKIMSSPNFAISLKKQMDKVGITTPDAHGLWSGLWDLDAEDTMLRKHLANGHKLCMEILADFGVKTYTVHIGAAECFTNGGLYTEAMHARALATLEAILPTAEKLGMVICVENAFEPANTPDNVLRCIEPFRDSPAIGCCLDVGHANIMNSDIPRTDKQFADSWLNREMWGGRMREGMHPMREAIRMLAPYLVTAHVHDNDGWSDQHRCPGMGVCNFDEVFAEFAKCPRFESVQNETSFGGCGVSIRHACEVFRDLMTKLH